MPKLLNWPADVANFAEQLFFCGISEICGQKKTPCLRGGYTFNSIV